MRRARNTSCIYTGRVGAKLRPSVRGMFSSRRVFKRLVRFHGGPLHGYGAWLEAPGGSSLFSSTLPIVCKGQAGSYINGAWCAA